VDNTGTPVWGSGAGVEVANVAGYKEGSRLASDGLGGAFVGWTDTRGGVGDVYAQWIDPTGPRQWGGTSGLGVCTAISWQYLSAIVPDGSGGAVCAWTDERNGFADVYAQRVSGPGVPQWTADGIAVASAARGQYEAAMHVSGGPVVLTWTDYRNGVERLLYSQELSLTGLADWTPDGVTDALFSMVAAEAGAGRVRVTWQLGSSVSQVTAYRRLDGETAWTSLGTLVVDGTGRVVLEDTAVEPGGRYVYRIGMIVDGAELYSDEVRIEVPNTLALAIENVAPQPARGDVWVTFTLPALAPARLEVLDVAGRRVASRELLGLSPGRHVLRVDEVPDAAGVYFMKVWQGGESVSARCVTVR